LTSLEFRSSKGTAVWPEEELEDLVCDVNMCYSYSNLESVRTNCSYDWWRSNKMIHQSKPASIVTEHVTILSIEFVTLVSGLLTF
jgi:hypothetical protein